SILVEHVARGDSRALERIYDRYSRGVYSLALRLLSDTAGAEEGVQGTFLKLSRQPRAYQPRRGRPLPRLLGGAQHHAGGMTRRKQLEQRHRVSTSQPLANGDGLSDVLDKLGISSADDDPQLRAGAFDQRIALGRALAGLPAEQRMPLELAYYRGMTQ